MTIVLLSPSAYANRGSAYLMVGLSHRGSD